MARQRSEFLSAFGVAFEIFKAIADSVKARGGNDDDLRRVLSSRELAEDIGRIIVEDSVAEKLRVLRTFFHIVVDYKQTTEEMVAAGKYKYVDPHITHENFPHGRGGTGLREITEVTLVHFGVPLSSEDAARIIARMGYVPATIHQLLAFGTAYPEEQGNYSVVALGSASVCETLGGYRLVAYFDKSTSGRALLLSRYDNEWRSDFRFAAVRKGSA